MKIELVLILLSSTLAVPFYTDNTYSGASGPLDEVDNCDGDGNSNVLPGDGTRPGYGSDSNTLPTDQTQLPSTGYGGNSNTLPTDQTQLPTTGYGGNSNTLPTDQTQPPLTPGGYGENPTQGISPIDASQPASGYGEDCDEGSNDISPISDTNDDDFESECEEEEEDLLEDCEEEDFDDDCDDEEDFDDEDCDDDEVDDEDCDDDDDDNLTNNNAGTTDALSNGDSSDPSYIPKADVNLDQEIQSSESNAIKSQVSVLGVVFATAVMFLI